MYKMKSTQVKNHLNQDKIQKHIRGLNIPKLRHIVETEREEMNAELITNTYTIIVFIGRFLLLSLFLYYYSYVTQRLRLVLSLSASVCCMCKNEEGSIFSQYLCVTVT